MHFEILVEDNSGKAALEILLPKLIDTTQNTYDIKAFNGIGSIPKHLTSAADAKNRCLLAHLPALLRAYGKTFQGSYAGVVFVVCDLDDKNLTHFKQKLLAVLHHCQPEPRTEFCLAIEEGEAWFLGDLPAIKAAYPNAKNSVLKAYKNDSICGTWETLADAVYPGGAKALKAQNPGREKENWANNIAPHMQPEQNLSPSFQYFVKQLRLYSSS